MAAGPRREPLRTEVVLSHGTGIRTAPAVERSLWWGGKAKKLAGIQGNGLSFIPAIASSSAL